MYHYFNDMVYVVLSSPRHCLPSKATLKINAFNKNLSNDKMIYVL